MKKLIVAVTFILLPILSIAETLSLSDISTYPAVSVREGNSKEATIWFIKENQLMYSVVDSGYLGMLSMNWAQSTQTNPEVTKVFFKTKAIIKDKWALAINSILSDLFFHQQAITAVAVSNILNDWVKQTEKYINKHNQRERTKKNFFVSLTMGGLRAPMFIPSPALMITERILNAALANLFVMEGETLDQIPAKLSSIIHDKGIEHFKDVLKEALDRQIDNLALMYTFNEELASSLEITSHSQYAQIEILKELLPPPVSLVELTNKLYKSRDMRLAFANTIVSLFNKNHSEAISNFIVSGKFSEMLYAETGKKAPTLLDRQEKIDTFGNTYLAYVEWKMDVKNDVIYNVDRGSVDSYYDRHTRVKQILPYWDLPVKAIDGGKTLLIAD